MLSVQPRLTPPREWYSLAASACELKPANPALTATPTKYSARRTLRRSLLFFIEIRSVPCMIWFAAQRRAGLIEYGGDFPGAEQFACLDHGRLRRRVGANDKQNLRHVA